MAAQSVRDVHIEQAHAYPGLLTFIVRHNADCDGVLSIDIKGDTCRATCDVCPECFKGVCRL